MRVWLFGLMMMWSGVALADDLTQVLHDVLSAEGAAQALRETADLLDADNLTGATDRLHALFVAGQDAGASERVYALVEAADKAVRAGDADAAKGALDEAQGITHDPRALSYIGALQQRLSHVGQQVGAPEIASKIQGRMPDWSKGSTLVVFWEPWCPHCQRELPALQGRLKALSAKGYQVVGVTALTRGSTLQDAREFAKERHIGFPLMVESGSESERFGVVGVPDAAIVKDGVIVWRGHPAQLEASVVDRFATK